MRWLRLLPKSARVARARSRELPLEEWIRQAHQWRVQRVNGGWRLFGEVEVEQLHPLKPPAVRFFVPTSEIRAAEALAIYGGDRELLERHTGVHIDDDGVSTIVR